MVKIKDKSVMQYVMSEMVWKADLPAFLKEIQECSRDTPYKMTFKIVFFILQILASRAIEINDPALNIIMINLGLYDGAHSDKAGDIKAELRNQIKLMED